MQLVIEKIHELFVILRIEFHQHGVRASCEMTLNNLRNGTHTLHHIIVHGASFEVETDICAGGIAQTFGVDIKSTTSDYPIFDKVLNTLVDGCA